MTEQIQRTREEIARGMFYVLDDTGTPRSCSMEEWCDFKREYGVCRIGHATIADVMISTVFLGIDHGIYEEGPILFETFMGSVDCSQGGVVARYKTYTEAAQGHELIVTKTQQEMDIPACRELPEDTKLFKPAAATLPAAPAQISSH
jgi:hypothetical protein